VLHHVLGADPAPPVQRALVLVDRGLFDFPDDAAHDDVTLELDPRLLDHLDGAIVAGERVLHV
jgi:hypothetical protein